MENFTFQICKLDLCHVDTTALVCPWLPSVTTKDKPQQQHLTISITFFFLSLQILYHHLFQKKYPFICLKLLLTPPKLARREKSFPQKKGGSWFSQPQNANMNLGYPNKIQSIAYIVTGKGVRLWRFQKRPKVSIQPVTCRPVSLRPFCFCLLLYIETASHTGIPLPFFTSVRYSMFSFTFTIQINLNSSSSNHFRSLAAGGAGGQRTLRSATQLAPFISAFFFFFFGAPVRIGWIYLRVADVARAGFCGVLISCSFTFHTCLRRIRRFRVNNNLRLAEQVPDCQSNSPEPPEPEERKKGKKRKKKKKWGWWAI